MASSSRHYPLIFTRDIALSLHIQHESPRCITLSSECCPLPYGGRLPTSRSTTTRWMRLPGMLGGGRGGQRGREGERAGARKLKWKSGLCMQSGGESTLGRRERGVLRFIARYQHPRRLNPGMLALQRAHICRLCGLCGFCASGSPSSFSLTLSRVRGSHARAGI